MRVWYETHSGIIRTMWNSWSLLLSVWFSAFRAGLIHYTSPLSLKHFVIVTIILVCNSQLECSTYFRSHTIAAQTPYKYLIVVSTRSTYFLAFSYLIISAIVHPLYWISDERAEDSSAVDREKEGEGGRAVMRSEKHVFCICWFSVFCVTFISLWCQPPYK